ncbi:methyltransferase [Streptomyces sp. XM4193]|uniref:methyltransferase n=1 Tax=Streptomyces sp. XM4193 TaxID=2929782 RepID=UPI001FFC27CC|nr:methyltransferase [Streptomyces sp. XM4193]MCK1799004.1 methyltransferase [Streptomyces sp. XM4193]
MTHRPAASQDDVRALLRSLPEAPPPRGAPGRGGQARAIHTTRTYGYNGWDFTVPPGVFAPDRTGRVLHDRLLNGTIAVAGRSYAAMGVGLGVEAVIAGALGAREVWACDIHPDSVATTAAHCRRLLGGRSDTVVRPLVGHLFEEFPSSRSLDAVTFNPPAADPRPGDDPTVVRGLAVGAEIVTRFFDQIADRELLAPEGEIHLAMTDEADLRRIVGHGADRGFRPEVVHREPGEDGGGQTLLFRFVRHAQPDREAAHA